MAQEVSNVRMLIVDPVVTTVAGDSQKNAEVRGASPTRDLGAIAAGPLVLERPRSNYEPTAI